MGDCLNANVFYNPSVSSKPLKITDFDDPPPFTQGRLGLTARSVCSREVWLNNSNFDLSVSLTCHCEERSDAAISLYRYLFNEIATPSARDDNVRGDRPINPNLSVKFWI